MIASILAALAAAFKAVATYLAWARDKALIALGAAQERLSATQAEAQTQEALKELADDRAAIPDPPADPDDLARSLRQQKSGAARSGRRRPF